MAETLEARMAEMQTMIDEQSRLLRATTEELEMGRACRRGDGAEAGREPGSPAFAASDRAQDSFEPVCRAALERRRGCWSDVFANNRATVRATSSLRHVSICKYPYLGW